MKLKKQMSVKEARGEEIRKLTDLNGTCGVIAIDTDASIAMEFNTNGMFRGYLKSTDEKEIAIFKEN